MKRILITLAALTVAMTASAQYGRGYGYRGGPSSKLEIGVTLNDFSGHEVNKVKFDRPDRVGAFLEYRVDVGLNMDLGLQVSTTFGPGKVVGTGYMDDAWFLQAAPLVVADFNLLPYSAFNPYVGLGIGPGFGYVQNKITRVNTWNHALVLSPRAGVELFEHLRLFVQYQRYLREGDRFTDLSFGLSWAFQTGSNNKGKRRY